MSNKSVGDVLSDGIKSLYAQPIDKNSEAWRFECEAKHVARLMWRNNENDFMKIVDKHRGSVESDRLKIRAIEIYNEYKTKQK